MFSGVANARRAHPHGHRVASNAVRSATMYSRSGMTAKTRPACAGSKQQTSRRAIKNEDCRTLLPLALLAAVVASSTVAAESKVDRDARMQWWRDARFGMFIHFGLYAVPAGEWNGKRISGGGEWIINNGHDSRWPTTRSSGDQFNP